MGILVWIAVGLAGAWLAAQLWKSGGYGLPVNIILGIPGGLGGSWLFGRLGIWPGDARIGSTMAAFLGAVILVWITHWLRRP